MAALEEQWLGRRGLSTSDIAGVVGLSGPYDFLPLDSDATIASFGHVDPPEITQPTSHANGDAPQMLLIHGERDTLVYPRNTRELAARLEASGGHALTIFNPEMEHNDPLIALAAPWRNRSEMVELIAEFAHAVSLPETDEFETSVPVQAESR